MTTPSRLSIDLAPRSDALMPYLPYRDDQVDDHWSVVVPLRRHDDGQGPGHHLLQVVPILRSDERNVRGTIGFDPAAQLAITHDDDPGPGSLPRRRQEGQDALLP